VLLLVDGFQCSALWWSAVSNAAICLRVLLGSIIPVSLHQFDEKCCTWMVRCSRGSSTCILKFCIGVKRRKFGRYFFCYIADVPFSTLWEIKQYLFLMKCMCFTYFFILTLSLPALGQYDLGLRGPFTPKLLLYDEGHTPGTPHLFHADNF